jgi:hypothetical protein
MRSIILMVCAVVALSGCGMNYRYQAEMNPQQFQGQNISAVQKQWGSADQVLHKRNGSSVYVYSAESSNNLFRNTSTNIGSGTNTMYPTAGYNQDSMSMDCSSVFTTDSTGVITNVWHKGSNCGGEWMKRTRPAQ